MIQVGKTNTLKVLRENEAGLYLGDDERNSVLLPASQLKPELAKHRQLNVFVYTDAEGRLLASHNLPYAEANSFAYLRVTDVTDFGAFMDWGLEKDLLVPKSQQNETMEADNFYVVYIYIDEQSNRLVGSAKIDRFISPDEPQLEEGQEVDLLVYEESPLGFSCIINGQYKGLAYHNDIYQEIYIGDELKGYVKHIRPDKLIDLSFQKSGFKNVLDSTDVVMEALQKNNGFIDLHDKSTPEDISKRLSMSKATFKKAIGILYRQRKVLIKPDGVYLVTSSTTDETT